MASQSGWTSSLNTSEDDAAWLDWLEDWAGKYNGRWDEEKRTLETLETPTIQPIMVYVAISLLIVPGLMGNTLLFLVSLHEELRSSSYRYWWNGEEEDVYLSCASVTDSLTLICIYVQMGLQANGIIVYQEISNIIVCHIVSFVIKTAFILSPWIMVSFSFDRYVAMVFPLKRKIFCTVRNAKISCTVIFVLTVILHIPSMTITEVIPFQGRKMCAMNGEHVIALANMEFALGSVVPCLLLIFLNTHSLIAIKRSMKERMIMGTAGMDSQARQQAERQADLQRESRKFTRALLTVPIATFLVMTPYAIITSYLLLSLYTVRSKTEFDSFLMESEPYLRVIMTTCFANNFYVLMATSKAYRKITRKVLRKCVCF